MTPSGTFECEACHGTFSVMPGNEEFAVKEAATLFPGLAPEDRRRVCDDCFGLLRIDEAGPWPTR